MDFGPAVGAGVSGLFGLGAAKQQQEHAEHMYKNRYQWTMKDLRKAGLNPMLAIGGAQGGVPTSATAPTPDFAGAVASGISTAREQERLDMEKGVMKASIDQANSVAAQNQQAVNTGKAQEAHHKEQAELTRQQIRNMQIDIERNRQDLEYDKSAHGQTSRQSGRYPSHSPFGIGPAVGYMIKEETKKGIANAKAAWKWADDKFDISERFKDWYIGSQSGTSGERPKEKKR